MAEVLVVAEADIKIPEFISAAVADPSRTEADRALDPHRKPEKLFAFFGIEPGQNIGELMCASGFNVGVLSPIVGGEGTIQGQNSPLYLERFGDRLAERISTSGLANVEQIIADMEHPGFTGPLDSVLSSMVYHDSVWMGMDRAAMNRAVRDSLKPGGFFCLVDHEAAAYNGPGEVKKTHRIARQFVIDEVTAAGFELVAEADIYANAEDTLDLMVFNKKIRHRTRRFVLKFRKTG